MALFEDKESLERSLRQWEATQVAKDAEIASAWTAYEATRAPLEAAKAQAKRDFATTRNAAAQQNVRAAQEQCLCHHGHIHLTGVLFFVF